MSRSIKLRRSILAISCGSILASTATAGPQLYDFNGTKNNDRLGNSIANGGDITGDGINDVICGAPEDGNVFNQGEGFISIFSGATGAHHMTVDGLANDLSFGTAVGGNFDADNDGTPDVVVGAPYSDDGSFQASGRVAVVSGATGLEIRSANGQAAQENIGRVVVGLGDFNNDGFDEYAAGSHSANSDRGVARVYSGQSGAEMYQFDGVSLGERLGVSLSRIGDVNNDGVEDIVVGTAFDGYFVFSGADGSEIRHTVVPAEPTLGISVSRIDDINNDGIDDIAVGATQFDIFSPGAGRVYVYSGSTGATLLTINGNAIGDAFGQVVSDAGDWDGDGKGDIMVTSAPQQTANFVTIHSGDNGAELDRFNPDNPGDELGVSLCAMGEIDGDGRSVVGAGAPETSGTFVREGLARLYKSAISVCGGTSQYCSSLPNSSGSTATITSFGSVAVSDGATLLRASNCPANVPGIFFYGNLQNNTPFGNGVRCVGGAIQRLSLTPTNGSGVADNPLFADPNNGILVAGVWNFQYWFRDTADGGPGAFNLSNGMSISFCP